VLPELVLFNSRGESRKAEMLYIGLWLIVMVGLLPSVILLQYFIKDVFIIWTKGKIVFDPILFSLLSASTLVYGLSQPVVAIVTGNNLLKVQVFVSVATCFILIIGIVYLTPLLGVKAIGITLLVSEFITYHGYKRYAMNWIRSQGMIWPKNLSNIATLSIFITVIGIITSATVPSYSAYLLLATFLVVIITIFIFCKKMPRYSKEKYDNILFKFLPFYRRINLDKND
jgi:hypothetical protein